MLSIHRPVNGRQTRTPQWLVDARDSGTRGQVEMSRILKQLRCLRVTDCAGPWYICEIPSSKAPALSTKMR